MRTKSSFRFVIFFSLRKCLQILAGQLEPLTDQQLMGICNLQQSSQQAEDALSQGMEALQQSLLDTLAAAAPKQSSSTDNVANYMNQMAVAMGKLGTLENFLRQVAENRQNFPIFLVLYLISFCLEISFLNLPFQIHFLFSVKSFL